MISDEDLNMEYIYLSHEKDKYRFKVYFHNVQVNLLYDV